MGTSWGVGGKLKIGANTVAEIDEWEINETVEPVEDTSMGDTWKTHIPGSGIKEWDGTLNCHFDDTDNNGQELMDVGASFVADFYPKGDATGAKFRRGTLSVIKVGVNVKKNGDTVRRSFSFQGNGELTNNTVGP